MEGRFFRQQKRMLVLLKKTPSMSAVHLRSQVPSLIGRTLVDCSGWLRKVLYSGSPGFSTHASLSKNLWGTCAQVLNSNYFELYIMLQ